MARLVNQQFISGSILRESSENEINFEQKLSEFEGQAYLQFLELFY
jgi:hypothetical protein